MIVIVSLVLLLAIQTNQPKIETQLKEREKIIKRLLKMGVPSLTPKSVTLSTPSVTLNSAAPVSPLTTAKNFQEDQVNTIL